MKTGELKKAAAEAEIKIENYAFEPIKGYPMLNWKGKRPFTSTQFFPAQLKESYGKPDANGWMNRLYWGDNLQVMSHLLKEFRGRVQLIYIDPPFDSKADYKKTIELRGKEVANDHHAFEEKQYTDIWNNDSYLQYMYERLVLMRELLSQTGVIYVHCDFRKSHHLRCILDEVFSPDRCLGEIAWKRSPFAGSSKARSTKFPVNHDSILYYSKTSDYFFQHHYSPYSEEYLERFKNPDNDPRGPYRITSLKTYSKETFERLKEEKRLVAPKKKGANWSYRQYLSESKGVQADDLWTDHIWADDIWTDINLDNPMSNSRTGYPTQKPEALLERIIHCSSQPGDIVFDCFLGSGTTSAVALRMSRRFVGADINIGSVQTTTKRLIQTARDAEAENKEFKAVGFSIFNVNHYDFFRNPVEAKELLLHALEVPKLNNSIYDGEKDGRMVKIMPVTRIATRSDLTDLISGFDYKTFEKRKKETPNKAVEKILLVCMGHEPDLAAFLEKEVPYKVDVEIVDILRDKSELQFKRDAEAKISAKKGKLIIEKFFPMNLLQKLSLQKEKVGDWKELVESILVDWNYDGAVLEPSVIDIPGKDALVKGEYEIPKDAGTIRVKITDLLSESLEVEVPRG